MFKQGDIVCLNEEGKKALGGFDPVRSPCVDYLLQGAFLRIDDVIVHPWGAISYRFFGKRYSLSSLFFTD